MATPTYLTPQELAARLRVHPQTLRNWRKSGKLRPAIETGRVIRYNWEQVARDLHAPTLPTHPAFEPVQS